MPNIAGFVVVKHDGALKRRRTSDTFFIQRKSAERYADREGDSVVPAYVDMDQGPVFIRAQTVKPT